MRRRTSTVQQLWCLFVCKGAEPCYWQVIKRRIEHLIEREYLERDEAQPNVYKYVA